MDISLAPFLLYEILTGNQLCGVVVAGCVAFKKFVSLDSAHARKFVCAGGCIISGGGVGNWQTGGGMCAQPLKSNIEPSSGISRFFKQDMGNLLREGLGFNASELIRDNLIGQGGFVRSIDPIYRDRMQQPRQREGWDDGPELFDDFKEH